MGTWCENSSKPLKNQSQLTYFYKNFTGGGKNWSMLIISNYPFLSSKTQNLPIYPFPVLSPKYSCSFNLFLMINMMFLLLVVMINIKRDGKYMLFMQVYLHFKKFSEGQITPKSLYVKLAIIG